MVQSPSWEANWFAASQEIPRISWNPKIHHCTHKRPPPVSILGQPNPVHIPTSHLLEIRPNTLTFTVFNFQESYLYRARLYSNTPLPSPVCQEFFVSLQVCSTSVNTPVLVTFNLNIKLHYKEAVKVTFKKKCSDIWRIRDQLDVTIY